MSQLEAVIQHNPFANLRFRPRRKLTFLLDQIQRFTALDPTGFAARILASQTIATKVSTALADKGSALSQRAGATIGSEEAIEALKKVVGRQFAIQQATLGKGSAGLVKLFGRQMQDYTTDLTHDNAPDRLKTLKQNFTTNAGIAGEASVAAITDAIGSYTSASTTQDDDDTTVLKTRTAAAQLTPDLDQVLWLNQMAIPVRYPSAADQPQRDAAADYDLLLPPAPGERPLTYADLLPGGATADVDGDDADLLPAPTTRLVLRNPGRVRLQVALSTSTTVFPSTGIIQEVAPGATLTLQLQDLGDPLALPVLLVHNPTSELGEYAITMG